MKVISCEFNIDTACVELRLEDGTLIAIDCTAVENEVADNMYERSELLCEKGGAYYCFCQKDDVEEAGSETGEIKKHVCACRDLPLDEAKKRVEAGFLMMTLLSAS